MHKLDLCLPAGGFGRCFEVFEEYFERVVLQDLNPLNIERWILSDEGRGFEKYAIEGRLQDWIPEPEHRFHLVFMNWSLEYMGWEEARIVF